MIFTHSLSYSLILLFSATTTNRHIVFAGAVRDRSLFAAVAALAEAASLHKLQSQTEIANCSSSSK